MKIKRAMAIVLRVLQGILLAFLLIAGIGSMPSIFGMMFLMMAVFVTPRKILDYLWEDWYIRMVMIVGLLYHFRALPDADVTAAARNMGHFLQPLWQMICSLTGQ